jgi:2',3'-cyclic-nucleotide 2'-phosphodiesterase (5'-nucleotidase family)
MLLITRRLATGLLLVPIGGIRFAGAAPDATARITFILVNDIYLMADELMPDGQRRGGFARLAAVVKAERAKAGATGGHVIFAHGGDTLSPSLMSGIDHGAHIVTLTNLIPPDIFAPGNHEFDFGKATFLQRMVEAKFPVYAANLRGPDGQPLPNFKDRSIVTVDGVRIGLAGATYDDSARASDPGDLRFLPTVATLNEQAAALRREGADFVVAVAHVTREQGYQIFRGRVVDLILTGHTHDLFIEYDGRTAMVESSYDAHYVTAIDIAINVEGESGRRRVRWWPQFRVIDTAMVTPDPEVAEVVAKFENELNKELDAPIGTTAVELDSRAATVRTREAAIGNLIADAMRWSAQSDVAVTNGGSFRGEKIYSPGTTITRREVLAELPFGNRLVTIDVRGSALEAAIENGLSRLPAPSGRFPQVAGLKIEADTSCPAGSRVL